METRFPGTGIRRLFWGVLTIMGATLITSCNQSTTDPWTFVHVADIQVGSPKSFRFAPAWNENWRTARAQILDIDPEFLLVGGDLTRDGALHRFEMEEIKADLDSLPFPVHVIAGNMDVGNKRSDVNGAREDRDDRDLNMTTENLDRFESVFGPLWWSFEHKNLRVSAFPDMLLGSGLPREGQLWDWLETQTKKPLADHQIWMMHYAMFADSLDEPNHDITKLDEYLGWYFTIDNPYRSRLMEIFKATGTDRVITGHIHCRKDHVAEGIAFDLAPATCFSQWDDRWPDGDPTLGFYRYDVYEDHIEKTFIPLDSISTAKGYGPGGHPRPEERNYSKAWEKGADL